MLRFASDGADGLLCAVSGVIGPSVAGVDDGKVHGIRCGVEPAGGVSDVLLPVLWRPCSDDLGGGQDGGGM
jgi:hypothetical protein